MSIDILLSILLTLTPIFAGTVAYFMKSLLHRIRDLENSTQHHLSDSDARQLLADKLDPIHADISDIKDGLNKLFDLFVQEIKKR